MTKIRVMWLLNHTTLRSFELDMLRRLGIDEVYTPKSFPYDESNLSASVTYDYDANLTIPPEDLSILNAQNWYESPSQHAWNIVNKYFDIVILAFFPKQMSSVFHHFNGQILLRVFGLSGVHSYTDLTEHHISADDKAKLASIGHRFWFASGYEHLKTIERGLFKDNDCYLPVGLKEKNDAGEPWTGSCRKILFVCPRINTSHYYHDIYQAFVKDFKGLPYAIGGAQQVPVNDPHVMGYLSKEEYERNMREMRVMFYHGTEPNHIHYHLFEAIRYGMPLVFMAGGMLDSLGGKHLPGRCVSSSEARRKLERILNNDTALIDSIRTSQKKLLEPMSAEYCFPIWRENFSRVLQKNDVMRDIQNYLSSVSMPRKKRIAVILPVEYKGGSLRGAKLLAEAIHQGSVQSNEEVEVILAHLDMPGHYGPEDFEDLPPQIKLRSYRWKYLDTPEAQLAMTYADIDRCLKEHTYQVPDDGMNYFIDCDLMVFVSDRLQYPILPAVPYVCMVYDYLQRYEKFLPDEYGQKFLRAAHEADKVLVTTDFTFNDAIQFAGLPFEKVVKCPMLVPDFSSQPSITEQQKPYFVWTTNLTLHKNHGVTFEALREYYESLDGQLKCFITGTETDQLLSSRAPHLLPLKDVVNNSPRMKKMVKILGELPDPAYQSTLASSEFLLHPARIDNGTFSVIEAAYFSVPSLSSDYPAMQEINQNFELNLMFMNPNDPLEMAAKLKHMEGECQSRRALLPTHESLQSHSVKNVAKHYWHAIKESL